MKKLILFISLFLCLQLNAQIQYASYSKQLLIGPESSSWLNIEVIDYYIETYISLKIDLEEEYESAMEIALQDKISEDIIKVEEMLDLWREEDGGNRFSEFLGSYKTGNCYELETSLGLKKNGDYEIVANDSDGEEPTLAREELEFRMTPGKTEWVKKKADKNCISSNPNDCYVACCVKTKDRFWVIYDGEEIEIGGLPLNFELNSEKGILEKWMELYPLPVRIIDKEEGEELKVYAWREVACE